MFNILADTNRVMVSLLVTGFALVISLAFTFIISLKLRASKGFFITSSLIPMIVAAIVSMVSIFLDGTTSNVVRIASVAVALGLIRFRSINARAEELLLLFAGIGNGLLCGLGYVTFAAILMAVIGGLYIVFSQFSFFEGKRFQGEKLLKITIPESLEFSDVFSDTFDSYLKNYELVEIKTSNMGSLFKLSYRIELKDKNQEKTLIDELRTKNGNLEISIIPYVSNEKVF